MTDTPDNERDEAVVRDYETPPTVKLTVDRIRENMRGILALGLLALLTLEVLYGVSKISQIAMSDHPQNAKFVSDWLTSVITGTIALLGAATGFYYGTRNGGP